MSRLLIGGALCLGLLAVARLVDALRMRDGDAYARLRRLNAALQRGEIH